MLAQYTMLAINEKISNYSIFLVTSIFLYQFDIFNRAATKTNSLPVDEHKTRYQTTGNYERDDNDSQ